jgi:hypothetical protein
MNFGIIYRQSGTVRLDAPMEPGEYEIRGYAKIGVGAWVESNLVAKAAFTVGGSSKGAYSFSLDRTSYAPGEAITVSVSDVSDETLEDEPFLALYAAGERHGNGLFYKRIYRSAEKIRLDAPEKPGAYEIRGYAKRGIHADSNLVGQANFTAGLTSFDAR